MPDPKFGEWLVNELAATLEGMLAETDLHAVRGRKTVEVKFIRANKGEIFERLNQAYPKADFLLAAGDDTTDEDLFVHLPASAWTIHVGNKQSRARFCLSDFEETHSLLSYLINEQVKEARR